MDKEKTDKKKMEKKEMEKEKIDMVMEKKQVFGC